MLAVPDFIFVKSMNIYIYIYIYILSFYQYIPFHYQDRLDLPGITHPNTPYPDNTQIICQCPSIQNQNTVDCMNNWLISNTKKTREGKF